MTQTEEGIDILARPWSGNCHSCDAQFKTTGEEIKRLRPNNLYDRIVTLDCPSCGGRNKLYVEPEHVPSPADIRRREANREARKAFEILGQEVDLPPAKSQVLIYGGSSPAHLSCDGAPHEVVRISDGVASVWSDDGTVHMFPLASVAEIRIKSIEPPAAPEPQKWTYTFDEFIDYGREQRDGTLGEHETVPWHFTFYGHPVTHENDDTYCVDGYFLFVRGGTVEVTAAEGGRYTLAFPPPADLDNQPANLTP